MKLVATALSWRAHSAGTLGQNYSTSLLYFVQIKTLGLSASSKKKMTSLFLAFLFILYVDSPDTDWEFLKVEGGRKE